MIIASLRFSPKLNSICLCQTSSVPECSWAMLCPDETYRVDVVQKIDCLATCLVPPVKKPVSSGFLFVLFLLEFISYMQVSYFGLNVY